MRQNHSVCSPGSFVLQGSNDRRESFLCIRNFVLKNIGDAVPQDLQSPGTVGHEVIVVTRKSLTKRNKFVLTRACGGEVLVLLDHVFLDDLGDEGGVEAGEDGLVDPGHVALSGQWYPLTIVLTVGETDVLIVVDGLGQLLYVD